VAVASRRLAEREGVTADIPDQKVLINTLDLHEATDSSGIESIVTTHDQLCREASLSEAERSAAGKEVLRYAAASSSGTRCRYANRPPLQQECRPESGGAGAESGGLPQGARDGIVTMTASRWALLDMKHAMQSRHKRIYSQDLLNLLFSRAYTRIQVVQDELGDSRITATTHLDTFACDGKLEKVRRIMSLAECAFSRPATLLARLGQASSLAFRPWEVHTAARRRLPPAERAVQYVFSQAAQVRGRTPSRVSYRMASSCSGSITRFSVLS
jgi:hypothetical protein